MFYLVVDERLKLSDKNMKIRIGEKIMMEATRNVQRKFASNPQQMREEVTINTILRSIIPVRVVRTRIHRGHARARSLYKPSKSDASTLFTPSQNSARNNRILHHRMTSFMPPETHSLKTVTVVK